MGKEFSSRKNKPVRQLPPVQETTVMEKETPENTDQKPKDPTEKSIEQQHKEFIKGGAEPIQKETTPQTQKLGPPVDMTPELEKPALEGSVFNTSTVENDYISKNRGINTPLSNGQTTPPPPNTSDTTSSSNSSNPSDTPPWEPTQPPPAPDSAPEANQGPPPNGMGGDQPFTIPAGTAEETIQWGFEMFNYGIRNLFGGFLVDVKVGKQHLVRLPASAIDPMSNLIKEKNEKNRERLTFTQEEINMIKRPLAKIMAEKGIRGLTPTEELAMAAIIIVGKKGKQIAEIRSENKILEAKIAQLIAEEYARQNKGKKKQDDAEEAEILDDNA